MIIVAIMMTMMIIMIITIMMIMLVVLMILMVNVYVIFYKSDQVCHENSDNHDDHCNRNDDLDGQLLCDLLQVRSGLSRAINKMIFF